MLPGSLCWLASERSVRDSVRNAMAFALARLSVGRYAVDRCRGRRDESGARRGDHGGRFSKWDFPIEARIVEYRPKSGQE